MGSVDARWGIPPHYFEATRKPFTRCNRVRQTYRFAPFQDTSVHVHALMLTP